MMNLENWLTLACENCNATFTPSDGLKLGGRCPECKLAIRPVISILKDAAEQWENRLAEVKFGSVAPTLVAPIVAAKGPTIH